MFRRYPYQGWLILSIIMWAAAIYYFHRHRLALLPERMAEGVYKDLRHREDVYEGYILERDWIRRMFSDSLSKKEMERVVDFPFFMYGYDNDSLKFWNTNIVVAPNVDTIYDKPIILRNEKGVFIEKIHRLPMLDGNKKLIVLFPIFINYPIENDYLRSYFVASKYIPIKTKIVPPDRAGPGDYLITMRGKVRTFYLHFNEQEIQRWVPDTWFTIMLLLALLFSVSWIDLLTSWYSRNGKVWKGLIVTLFIIIILKLYLILFGLPFNLDTLDLFSPQLYASSNYLSSLGDLFIDTIFVLWILIFITRFVPYKTFFQKVYPPKLRIITAFVVMLAAIAYSFLFADIIKSLVLDSRISFDVSHFYAINFYTILGLFVIVATAGASCLITYLVNVQLNTLIEKKWLKYLLIILAGGLFTVFTGKVADILCWLQIVWCISFVAFLDKHEFKSLNDILKPEMIYWAALFICGFSTGVLQYYNEIREKETRKAFVTQRLSPHRDNVMEYAFDKTAKNIAKDKMLKSIFYSPNPELRKIINQRFDAVYFTGPVNKYYSRLYLFYPSGEPVYNKDTLDFWHLTGEKRDAIPTNSPYLFYKESIPDRHYYLSFIPIYNDTIDKIIGYVYIDFELKKRVAETVYPELMQPVAGLPIAPDNEYAYAEYVNDRLITQTNTYPFPVRLYNDTLQVQQYRYSIRDNILELYYKVADKRTVVVIHYHSLVIELMTLFSYLFVSLVFIFIIIYLYRLYISYFTWSSNLRDFKKFTIQKQLHYYMLGIAFFSFLLIGFFTGKYFSDESTKANENKLQIATQIARQSVQDYLKQANTNSGEMAIDSAGRSSDFKYFLNNLANSQKVDINIFDKKGNLFATSQEEIYDKGLISHKMRPKAYHQLNTEGISIVIEDEKVGDLPYISLYEPLRNENGTTLGYINVPFFSSEKDLNYQIYNIIVTLINIYAFIFLISGFITVGITQHITKSFNLIIRHFEGINLKLNERIDWPFDDEIGILVSKYNEMVKKVEENAATMAQSERELAWREMARQVAHEIKNPLTPMKLNIQYLQQAIRNNDASLKIKELTDKVTESIIEQIDNLAYIASEFSDFAKMPEAREEELELNTLLGIALELYTNDDTITVTCNKYPMNIMVSCDRSQLLRVFNNLLDNAKQAIPAGKTGKIDVTISLQEKEAIISITDNGTGISDATSKKIFQPYFTTKSSGTGLGLAMTKRIIEFWKGRIWFETQESVGTTFYVSLPVKV